MGEEGLEYLDELVQPPILVSYRKHLGFVDIANQYNVAQAFSHRVRIYLWSHAVEDNCC